MQWCFQVMLAERSAKHHRNSKMMLDGGCEHLTKPCKEVPGQRLKLGDIYF